MAIIDLASYRSAHAPDTVPEAPAVEQEAPQESAAPVEEAAQNPDPAEVFIVGPCEGAFNQMMAEMNAQIRRASIANPTMKPQINMMLLMRSMMRATDAVLAVAMGQVDELRGEFYGHKHDSPDGLPVPAGE